MSAPSLGPAQVERFHTMLHELDTALTMDAALSPEDWFTATRAVSTLRRTLADITAARALSPR